jgi:CRISPR-associated endonuclease Csn1
MSQKSVSVGPYVLGLDIGASSVGWAILALGGDAEPCSVIAAGSRLFEAGVEGSFETGRDTPRGVARRMARLQRRQTVRRARRRRKLWRVLQDAGLLPRLPVVNYRSIHETLRDLDVRLRAQWVAPGDHRSELVFPFQIRAAACSSRLQPFELGRAIYHLAQRRGFLSNRKTRAREDQEGVVKQGIDQLTAEMTAAGHRTLGEHFAALDPRTARIRKRYTHRAMYEREFDLIAQANDWVPAESWASIRKIIFFQRKLKSSAHLIGRCPCVPKANRAPSWHPSFQQYRILEQVANLRVRDPGSHAERALSEPERSALTQHLAAHAKVTAAGVRKALGLPKGSELSIDTVGSGAMIGDRTAGAMRAVFGSKWDAMSDQDRMAALLDVHSYEQADALRRRGMARWGLEPEAAAAFSEVQLEPSYAALSVRAIERLLPHLRQGLNARQAIDIEFPGRFAVGSPEDRLPPIGKAMPDLRNPAVARALAEVRRIVNRVVDRWGKPTIVRLELARDLKRSRMQRERLAKENRAREAEREQAARRILSETTVANPRRSDVEKLLLAEECGFVCPYTGRSFGMGDLFGPQPQVDVEHIIPYSRSLDDSFANKTLCFVSENRDVKQNRTPLEAYASDAARWEQILGRVERFRGGAARFKLERFLMDVQGGEVLDEFVDRQLNDTRFASRMAAMYVGRLYGGMVDSAGVRRVQAGSGSVTARLRQAWRMGLALHGDGEKNRGDHRHHALDAVAIALSTPSVVKRMADAAARGAARGRSGRLLEFSEPWPRFLEEVTEAMANIVASHRVDRRLAGSLHEETYYSRPLSTGGGLVHRRRKGVASVATADIEEIADPRVRSLVSKAIDAAPKGKLDPASPPIAVPERPERIRHVRVGADRVPVRLDARTGPRFVAPASNHHMALYVTPAGEWVAEVVTRLEAHRRKVAGEPIVRVERADGAKLLFTLRSGDTLRLKDEAGQPMFVVVRGVSGTTVEALRVNDGRSAKEVRAGGAKGGRLTFAVRALRIRETVKVDLSPIGEVTLARE